MGLVSADSQPVDKSRQRLRKKAERRARQDAMVAAVSAAERLRNGTPPTAEQLAIADPEVLNSELQVILATVTAGRTPAKAADPSAPLPAHRPSEYSEEEAEQICQWIQDGKSLRSYALHHNRAMGTVHRWLASRPAFRDQFARAYETRADTLVDEMCDIADRVAPTIEAVAKAKLQIETRRWCAERMRPQKWGLQQQTGPQQPITFNIGIAREGVVTIEGSPASPALPALPEPASD